MDLNMYSELPVPETIFPTCNTQIGNDSINVPISRKRSRSCLNNGDLISVTNLNAGKATFRSGPVAGDGRCVSLNELTASMTEMDRSIFLHMEKIKNEIEEKTKIQWNRTMRAIQEAIFTRLRQKDDEIANIVKLNANLQDHIRSLYLENQLWKELAQSNEVTINALRSQLLTHLNNKPDIFDGYVDVNDTESCCGSNDLASEDDDDDCDEVDERQILRWRKIARRTNVTTVTKSKRKCRKCDEMDSIVLVLPCRHLCLCTTCAPTVDTCPVCDSNKNASVLVSFS